jgi:hypothetical protein
MDQIATRVRLTEPAPSRVELAASCPLAQREQAFGMLTIGGILSRRDPRQRGGVGIKPRLADRDRTFITRQIASPGTGSVV